MDVELANRKRDKRLRRKLLNTLKLSRAHSPSGYLGGETLRDLVDGVMARDQRFEDERHALELMLDLVNGGYAERKNLTRRRNEQFGLRHVELRITDKGLKLWSEEIPPDPLIDDDRITEEA